MSHPENGLFLYHRKNIGDDIQSFSVLQHLASASTFCAREDLKDEKSRTRFVMNSWFMYPADRKTRASRIRSLFSRFWPRGSAPSASVEPVFFGFCLGRPAMLQEGWSDYLKRHAPIGCRDEMSVAELKQHGIDAYWSGCLTMFAGRRIRHVPPESRTDILLVDVDEETERTFVPRAIGEQAVRLTNTIVGPITRKPIRRLAEAGRIIDRLASAKLVVTRRLHIALPCVGLGVPVVALPDPTISEARWRFSGYQKVIPVIFKDDPPAAADFDWHAVAPGRVPDELEPRYSAFLERIGAIPPSHGPASGPNITLRDPGLKADEALLLRLGASTEVLDVVGRDGDVVEVDMPWFAGLDRLDAEVRIGAPDGTSRAVGTLDALRIRS